MQNYDLFSLNSQQLEALYHTEGAVLVTAGAGSGKTRLLTHRIAYLIKEKQINPYNILAITFTNKAATEMAERTMGMIETPVSPWISTFHSMCAKILRKHINLLGYTSNFSIYTDSDSDKLLTQIIEEKNLGKDKDMKKTCSFHISNCKNNNMSISEYALNFQHVNDIDVIISVFEEYQRRLKNANALDFDDLLTKTVELFKTNKEVLSYYANRFEYVLVDEFQDTNLIQYEIVKMLSCVHKNVFVVGDEDQCIYTWRGASYKNISSFVKEFDAKVYKLETNYRSTPNILAKANQLIANNAFRIDKTLVAVKDGGSEPEYYKAYDEQEEANFVASKLSFLVKEKGYKYSDFAILMRVNSLSLAFEQTLLSYNIPYRIFGGFKFFERAEIKIVLSYLKLFDNPQDEVAFLRVINTPKRGIGDGAISKLKELSTAIRKPLIEIISQLDNYDFPASTKAKFISFIDVYNSLQSQRESLSLGEFARAVVNQFELKSMYNTAIDEELYKVMNIETLLSNIDEFAEKNKGATLLEYLESVTLMSDIDDMDLSNMVTIATIHAVKGLEFKTVFIVGVEEGLFPISRAFNSPSDMEEERRLMYVALTRAEERLYLTSTTSRFRFGKRDYSIQSRFIEELGFSQKLASPVKDFGFKSSLYYDDDAPKGNFYADKGSSSLNNFKNNVFAPQKAEVAQKDTGIYKVGQIVEHKRFGRGQIVAISGGDADIKFDTFGLKTLILSLAPLEILE